MTLESEESEAVNAGRTRKRGDRPSAPGAHSARRLDFTLIVDTLGHNTTDDRHVEDEWLRFLGNGVRCFEAERVMAGADMNMVFELGCPAELSDYQRGLVSISSCHEAPRWDGSCRAPR